MGSIANVKGYRSAVLFEERGATAAKLASILHILGDEERVVQLHNRDRGIHCLSPAASRAAQVARRKAGGG